MSLDKAIASGKEKRKPRPRYEEFDPSCRNHGRCPYCRDNRLYRIDKNRVKSDQDLKDGRANGSL